MATIMMDVVEASRPVGFLNVDLVIESASKLDTLAREIGDAGLVLYSGPGKNSRRLLCMESSRQHRTPDAAIQALCNALDQLTLRGKRLWGKARRKEFDVGYELKIGTRASHFSLKSETLRRIVALGASVAFTCYRESSSEQGCVGRSVRRSTTR